jgi:hypothetical protein
MMTITRKVANQPYPQWLLAAAVALSLACLAGCASGPPPPDWKLNARDALENATTAYFAGNLRQADAEFARARSEIASTGRADLLARAVLTRCAAQVASIDFAPCSAYDALDQDAGKDDRAYAAFLAGQWEGLKAEQLPPQHRPLLAAKTEEDALKALRAIKDPLARLVDAGILLRTERITPDGIAVAVATASGQGWKRPLLAWLGLEAQRADRLGDPELAARVRRRMALVVEGR